MKKDESLDSNGRSSPRSLDYNAGFGSPGGLGRAAWVSAAVTMRWRAALSDVIGGF